MTFRFPLVCAAALVLAACASEPEPPFSNPTEGFDATDQTFVEGSPQDPNSLAYFQQTVGDRVLFEVDASTLTPQAREVLDLQADFLLRNMEYLAIVEGHADEQGTREYNLALGARRAASVRDHLVSRGIASDRIRTVSYGKERPIQVCSNESCYAQNRRGVTVLDAPIGGGA